MSSVMLTEAIPNADLLGISRVVESFCLLGYIWTGNERVKIIPWSLASTDWMVIKKRSWCGDSVGQFSRIASILPNRDMLTACINRSLTWIWMGRPKREQGSLTHVGTKVSKGYGFWEMCKIAVSLFILWYSELRWRGWEGAVRASS